MSIKNVISYRFVITFVVFIGLISCKSSGDRNVSRGTGWEINSREGGFQYNTNYKEQEAGPGLVFIEGGTFTMGKVQDDVMHDWNNTPNQQHVQSFYMDETEVTNKMYTEYLEYIKRVYPPKNEMFRAVYAGIVPDTLVWRNPLGYNEVMVENYLRHPAYGKYPVVGVSWIQAVEYANWRTDRYNELRLEKEGYLLRNAKLTSTTADSNFSTETYLNDPTKVYGGNDSIIRPQQGRRPQVTASGDTINVFANRQTGVISPKYRLPTEAEWEYAALALPELREYNLYRGRKKYPWTGMYTRSGNRRTMGDQNANFKQGNGDYGGIAGWSTDGAAITDEVKSHEPNDFGLYDMAGNVAEWVADVYRPILDNNFNDFNYYRGNVYTKNAINEDGTVKIVTSDNIVFDTLSNGSIVARDLSGEILQVGIEEEETFLRTNYNRSDNRNYRDGDKYSSRELSNNYDEGSSISQSEMTSNMYNAPRHTIEVDSATGEIIKKYDPSNSRTSLITDNARVYKGGSWRDRAYWLDPAQRRYYPQDMATDYIGFRCAMSRVGSKSDGKKSKN